MQGSSGDFGQDGAGAEDGAGGVKGGERSSRTDRAASGGLLGPRRTSNSERRVRLYGGGLIHALPASFAGSAAFESLGVFWLACLIVGVDGVGVGLLSQPSSQARTRGPPGGVSRHPDFVLAAHELLTSRSLLLLIKIG